MRMPQSRKRTSPPSFHHLVSNLATRSLFGEDNNIPAVARDVVDPAYAMPGIDSGRHVDLQL